jgi:hypothetical protein
MGWAQNYSTAAEKLAVGELICFSSYNSNSKFKQ